MSEAKISFQHTSLELPQSLKRLEDLAYNLLWSWHEDIQDVFREIDPDTWERVHHNPIKQILKAPRDRLLYLSTDKTYLSHVESAYDITQKYLTDERTWYHTHSKPNLKIAYFSAEYGIANCLPIYAGGLGVLSGEHVKSASDLGLPLVAVGLLYQQRFRQYLNAEGWQQESFPLNTFDHLPLRRLMDAHGNAMMIEVPLGEQRLFAQVWEAKVGRVSLYLLDTHTLQNDHVLRSVCDQLYGGGTEKRICQEILLGIGGVRVLQKLGIEPTVYHMNEGHSAFLVLERQRALSSTLQDSAALLKTSQVFTTHTPVAAGFDHFDKGLLRQYVGPYLAHVGIEFETFFKWGVGEFSSLDTEKSAEKSAMAKSSQADMSQREPEFNMAMYASRHSAYMNGVSELHADVSRRLWQAEWKGTACDQIPIFAVTNGIHLGSWVHRDLKSLFSRKVGDRWQDLCYKPDVWNGLDQISDSELWRLRSQLRQRLIDFCRARLKTQMKQRGEPLNLIERVDSILSPHVLTIGFARRFATYKRATLLFQDVKRLTKLICASECPVQFIFAGKSHPKDVPGKEFIQKVFEITRTKDLFGRVVYLEDYDIHVARALVQGVDVWLNNPRKPLEASGTSGMKVVANGGLTLSVLDGWWAEGYTPEVGWQIESHEDEKDLNQRDILEALSLYTVLEKIISEFYYRDSSELPTRWLRRMRSSMKTLIPKFNTHRMLIDYMEKAYVPAHTTQSHKIPAKVGR